MNFTFVFTMRPLRSKLLIAILIMVGGMIAPQANAEGTAGTSPDPHHPLVGSAGVVCEIVVPADAPSLTKFAGKELQQILSQSFGGEVPLVEAPGDEAATSIVLGSSFLPEGTGINLASVPRDGFVIRSAGKAIHIAGEDGDPPNTEALIGSSAWHLRGQHPQRGTLNGVYEFLERYLGVRFYFPGRLGTIIPRHADLSLPALDLSESPAMVARSMGYSGSLYEGFEKEGYPGKNREAQVWYYKTLDAVRLRLQTAYIPHCHGLSRYGYIERFGASHPEYFALMGNGRRHGDRTLPQAGQLCFSSGVREEIYLDAKAYLTGQSAGSRGVAPRGDSRYFWPATACQPGYFDIMPQDGFYPCHCEPCQRHFQGLRFRDMNRKATSKFMWDFFCDVAERLQKEKVPGSVTTMAYPPYGEIPDRSIPENLKVGLCPLGPDAVRDFDKVREHVRGWYEKTGQQKLWLWINVGKYNQMAIPGVPFIIPRATGRYFKELSPYISGAYFTLIMNDFYLYKYLNAYVANKVMWDPEVDVDALLDEHYHVMFGPAALRMEKIYDRFEKIWLEQIRGNTVETSLGETAVPPSEYQLWNEIYSAAEIASLEKWFDEAEKQSTATPDFYERVVFMRENLLGPLIAAREEYQRTLVGVEELQIYAPMLQGEKSLTINGTPDEAVWNQAEAVLLTPFKDKQRQTPATRARVLRNETHLFIALTCEEPEMEKMIATDLPRDSGAIFNESSIEVFANPSGDLENYRHWAVNAAGAMTDMAGKKQGTSQTLDREWQSDAEVAVGRTAHSWSVELAIPLRELEPYDRGGFPINFVRNRVLKGEAISRLTWSPYLRRGFHELENFGHLRFHPTNRVNLVKDGDFASSPVGGPPGRSWWGPGKSLSHASVESVDETLLSSGRALRLEGGGEGSSVSIRQYLPDLEPNRKYRCSFRVRTNALVPVHRKGGARVGVWGAKSHAYPLVPYTGTQPWQRQSFTFQTDAGANVASRSYLSLVVREAGGVAWFGDLRIQPVE